MSYGSASPREPSLIKGIPYLMETLFLSVIFIYSRRSRQGKHARKSLACPRVYVREPTLRSPVST